MKKYLVMIVLAMLCVGALTQSTVGSRRTAKNKLINQAYQRGRSNNEFYEVRNEGSKYIKPEKMMEEIRSEGCIVGGYTTKTISRYGDVASTLSTMKFLPKDEYESYMYYNLNSDWSTSYEQLAKRGSAYCYTEQNQQNSYFVKYDNIRWSGELKDGFLDGAGVGFAKLDEKRMIFFKAFFDRGVPVGDNSFVWCNIKESYGPYSSASTSTTTSHVGKFYDDLADIKIGDKFGFISRDARTAISVEFKSVEAYFANGRATVTNEKEEIIIDRTGKQVDLSDRQKKIYADIKAEEDRKAEEARQAELEKERLRLLAEQQAAEERRQAEAKEADLKRRIEINKNPKLWTRGCRLAYRYPNGKEYVLATLEEWNEGRTKVKVKIVASPSSTRTLNGDLLEKNNTMWVSVRNEGWHLALDEEITLALNNDNSTKRTEVITTSSSSSSYSPSYSDCSSCNGTGYTKCYSCNGSGRVDNSGWGEDASYETCSSCRGRGRISCSSCNGSGRR